MGIWGDSRVTHTQPGEVRTARGDPSDERTRLENRVSLGPQRRIGRITGALIPIRNPRAAARIPQSKRLLHCLPDHVRSVSQNVCWPLFVNRPLLRGLIFRFDLINADDTILSVFILIRDFHLVAKMHSQPVESIGVLEGVADKRFSDSNRVVG